MQIKQFVVGDVATNCYLVWDETSHEGAIVDPGDRAEQLIQTIQAEHIQLMPILTIFSQSVPLSARPVHRLLSARRMNICSTLTQLCRRLARMADS